MLLGSTLKLTQHLFFWFPNLLKIWVYSGCFSDIFGEFFNFAFTLAKQHHWATAYLFVPQMVTLAGFIVLSGHLVYYFVVHVKN